MERFGLHGVFLVGSVAFVSMMGWLYAATGASAFLGMAGFGLLWAAASVAAVVEELHDTEEEQPSHNLQPAHS